MKEPDYSIHYARFHNDSEAHAEEMARGVADTIGPYLPADHSAPIIDVGCGYGFALRALRNLGYRNFEGVETSSQQAERCRRAGFKVDVTTNTIDWLRNRSAQYDFVVLLDVLEHVRVEVQIDFLSAVAEALRPGGRLLLTTPNANSPLAARWRFIDHTHYNSFTEHSLFYVLKNASFDTIDIARGHGIGRMPRRLWRKTARQAWRKWFVRWCWLQVFKAELPWEKLDEISFELNLRAVAGKSAPPNE